MNKDLKEYIDSFKGKELDDRDLLAIGKMHKNIPMSERNWKELTTYLQDNFGVLEGKTSEAYRDFVKSRQAEEGSLPVKDLSGNIIDNQEDINDKIETLYKERTKTRDTFNSYRKSLRDDARIEQLKDCIGSAVGELKELPKVKVITNKSGNSEAVLLLSDLHIGVDCNNFYNQYNTEVAAKRLSKLAGETKEYCKKFNVVKLNILNLGDMIHGIIHTNARIEEKEDVISQVMVAGELLANALNELSGAAKIVTYRSCSDNHSRVTSDKHEAIEKENFGRLIDWFLKERLKNSNINFIDDNLDYGLGKFRLDNNKLLMFCHGHQDNYNSIIQNFTGASKEFVDYVCLGHYHSSKSKGFQGSKVFVNGSIVGTEEYALSKRLFSQPEQTLLIFDNNNVVNITLGLGE